jgi:hypothetical protein
MPNLHNQHYVGKKKFVKTSLTFCVHAPRAANAANAVHTSNTSLISFFILFGRRNKVNAFGVPPSSLFILLVEKPSP